MNIALIFAGGTGQRMNSKSKPKQFLELHGKPIIIYTIEWFEEHSEIDEIVIVCLEGWISYLKDLIDKYGLKKVKCVVKGGETSQASIYSGLEAIYKEHGDKEDAIVLVHDGVRPLISKKLITDNINSVKCYGNAITISDAKETITTIDSANNIDTVLNRSLCRMAKAPQSFYLQDIYKAHQNALKENKNDFIDSAEMMKKYGHKLHGVIGPNENLKITTPIDYYVFRAICDTRENSQIFGIVGE